MSSRIPYGTRLLMGTIGNLQGVKRRLNPYFPSHTEEEAAQISEITRKVDELIHLFTSLAESRKPAGTPSVPEVQAALQEQSVTRAKAQESAQRC
jgi:hypothetical protein